MSRLGRPSPALIISVFALVFAMAGTGYAAFKLPQKSVGTKQLKANAVTNAKVKNGTLTGKKINLKTLGVVPNATHATAADTATTATTATTANGLPTPELHLVGAPGQPGFLEGAHNVVAEGSPPFQFVPAAFFKDHDGVVHLEGLVEAGSGGEPVIFALPPGYRPANGRIQIFSEPPVVIFGSNVNVSGKDLSGIVLASAGEASLSGVTFRAES
jgi:hypothetical protein